MSDDNKYRVWVGCLACYNNGALVGEWFDAEDAPTNEDAFNEAIPGHVKYVKSDFSPHEEIWVFDHENSPVDGEYSPNAAVEYAEWLDGLNDGETEIFKLWLKHESQEFDADSVETFHDRYAGCFEEGADAIEDLYPESELPEWAKSEYWTILRSKFEDLDNDGAYYTIETGYKEVHVFRNY